MLFPYSVRQTLLKSIHIETTIVKCNQYVLMVIRDKCLKYFISHTMYQLTREEKEAYTGHISYTYSLNCVSTVFFFNVKYRFFKERNNYKE